MAETLRLSEKEAGDPFPGPSRLELWVTLLWCDSFPWTSENFPFLGSACQGFYQSGHLSMGPVALLDSTVTWSSAVFLQEKKQMEVTALE